jgi:hypothetical protein
VGLKSRRQLNGVLGAPEREIGVRDLAGLAIGYKTRGAKPSKPGGASMWLWMAGGLIGVTIGTPSDGQDSRACLDSQ